MPRLDPHSFSDSEQPQVEHLDWHVRVDFAGRQLHAEAVLTLGEAGAGPLDLDTRDLTIEAVDDGDGRPLPHRLGPPEPILGSCLRVELPTGTRRIRIRYRTSPGASALQWLEPAQTAGGQAPFLFSQCQAIHARSVVPIQDTPRVRVRFDAALTVPRGLRAVMAAEAVERQEQRAEAVERFRMPQPIPPYLLALAVGDLVSRDLGPRSRVWAEPRLVERAAWEFEGVEQMIAAGEELFGAYVWDRFDILTMPPSFPYGGMENPRLTFITPTVLAGDRSLVDVIAHELAHAWTGNLVTNASAEHFWLNEGFTTYAERRIMEALRGREAASLSAALGWRELVEAIEHQLAGRPELTRLRTQLRGVDPDETFSVVPYEKGYLFLWALEEAVGRARFDAFLRDYIRRFQFASLTTEEFVAHAERQLPGALAAVDAHAWLYQAGIPSSAPRPRSRRLEVIQTLVREERVPPADAGESWTATEWQVYLESLPRAVPTERLAELDGRFSLTARQNCDVLVSWLTLAARSGYVPARERIAEVLGAVGRIKYLRPLYTAVAQRPETRAWAAELYARFEARYHPIARQAVGAVLKTDVTG